MGKLKKNKDTTKTGKPEIIKASIKTPLKPNKIEKPKKLAKKIKTEGKKIIEKSTENKSKCKVSKEQLQKGLEALLLYEEKNQTKDLFTREKPLFLQIDAIRIPHCPNRRIRLPLKHTLLTDKQEVCLIVPDLKKGRRIDHEPTIEHYEDLLRSKNVKSIKRILPIRQLRVEYDQFELKRRLCGYYDYFLVAGNISGHVLHLLGKTFLEKRKAPIPINLEASNMVDTIEKALTKATIHIHPKGATYVVQFGHSDMSIEHLTDNLKAVVDKLVIEFPGGWQNIRALHVKTDKSIAIPVYYTLKSANKVNVPVIKPTRPKEFAKITEELTTTYSKVTVHPGGKVETKKQLNTEEKSKNQLRKIRQGKIHKRSLKLRARTEKLRAKEKIKSEIKKQTSKQATQIKVDDILTEKTSGTPTKKQNKNKKAKKAKSPAVKQESQTKKRKSPKIKQEVSVKQEVSIKQEIAKKEKAKSPKIKKENVQKETKGKKVKKNKKKSTKKTIVNGA